MELFSVVRGTQTLCLVSVTIPYLDDDEDDDSSIHIFISSSDCNFRGVIKLMGLQQWTALLSHPDTDVVTNSV